MEALYIDRQRVDKTRIGKSLTIVDYPVCLNCLTDILHNLT